MSEFIADRAVPRPSLDGILHIQVSVRVRAEADPSFLLRRPVEDIVAAEGDLPCLARLHLDARIDDAQRGIRDPVIRFVPQFIVSILIDRIVT